MQTKDALYRVAAECAEDLANDGIVYAEVRFAPELHVEEGLTLDEVVEAVLAGFADGSADTGLRRATRRPVTWMRSFQYIQRENFHFTIHAGEAYGPPSIWEAIQYCGAERLGHGVRIIDDITVHDSGEVELGRLASYVRDRRIPLEVCPTSNVHTGAAASIAEHPIGLLTDLSFRITMNTDNRLMSSTSMSHEFAESAEAFNWDWKVIRWMTVNAMKSAFIPFDERLEIINDTIKPLVRRARTTRRKPAHRTPPVLRALGPHNCIDTVASMSNYRARAALAADVERIKEIAVAAEMFSVDEVSFFDDMLAGFFDGSLEGHRWLVIDDGHGQVLAAANYAPEPFSDRMWNLYFIAVDPEHQGAGLGSTLMAHAESELRAKGPEQARVLIVETSSTDQFARTRDFYAKIGSVTTKRPVCVSSMVQTMTRSCSGNRWWPERFCVSCRLVQRGGEVVVDGGVVAAQGRGVDRLEVSKRARSIALHGTSLSAEQSHLGDRRFEFDGPVE
ncbi:Adenosine deaminase 1 [Nymphon striatum]|nr:Adenosine deaminase 1 [Nymphon striatum]